MELLLSAVIEQARPAPRRAAARAASLVAAALMLASCGPTIASSRPVTVTGTVVAVDDDSLVVRTRAGDSVVVELADSTRFVKWITAKPWQQSTRATRSFLRVGKRVIVETAPGERRPRARIVRIATD